MKSLRAEAFGIALALVAAVLLIWKPSSSCNAPNEVCSFASAVAQQEGLLGYQASSDIVDQDPFAKSELAVELQFVLSDQLDAAQAGALAKQLAQQVQAKAAELRWIRTELSLVAGAAEQMQGLEHKRYPLEVAESFAQHARNEQEKPGELGKTAAFAFSMHRLGAPEVRNYSATANSLEQFLVLGKSAAQQQSPAELAVRDSFISYSPGRPSDYSEIELIAEAVRSGQFQSVHIVGSGLEMTVREQEPAGRVKDIQKWLDQHKALNRPVPYRLFSHTYSEFLEGWVGGMKPDWLIPKPVDLPENIEAWPKDRAASMCAADDLQILLGAPEAATGSRYMSVYAKNTSTHACALESYPQIDFLNEASEPQQDVQLQPEPGIMLERVLIPAGQAVLSTLEWNAMSTSLDPDQTVALRISAAKAMASETLTPEYDGQPVSLDILDGAKIAQSPWVQARDGWATAQDALKPSSPNAARP
ncbi:DUF4232 domain-containing protein [Glutamicibacter arilaitensis]|uniref:DUF4232 domain-containing protein n=1 Tax=Glutamicibacter arilaitensis TaxID=256701 RepID=UPI003A8FDC15